MEDDGRAVFGAVAEALAGAEACFMGAAHVVVEELGCYDAGVEAVGGDAGPLQAAGELVGEEDVGELGLAVDLTGGVFAVGAVVVEIERALAVHLGRDGDDAGGCGLLQGVEEQVGQEEGGEVVDGVAHEQRKRLKFINEALEDVKKRLGRIWHAIETTDIGMSDAADRIREHWERKEKLETSAEEAREILSKRRVTFDKVEKITAFAQDMSGYLQTRELTECRAFIESFVKEIVIGPGEAKARNTTPMPKDSRVAGLDAEEMAIPRPVLSTVNHGRL